jgi:hypothetical protein
MFATIGNGRRTRFFLRLARAMPERLRVRDLSQALRRCRSAGGSTLVEAEA